MFQVVAVLVVTVITTTTAAAAAITTTTTITLGLRNVPFQASDVYLFLGTPLSFLLDTS